MENIAPPAPRSVEGRAEVVDTLPSTVQQTRQHCNYPAKLAGRNYQYQCNPAVKEIGAVALVEQGVNLGASVKAAGAKAADAKAAKAAAKAAAAANAAADKIDAVCWQLLSGHEVGSRNHDALMNAKPKDVAITLLKHILFEYREDGRAGDQIKRSSPILPGAKFEEQLQRFFLYLLERSTKAVWSFAGERPDEPWIAGFCDSVVSSKQVPTVADAITRIAETCLERVNEQKLREAREREEVQRKRKATHDAELSERLGFGGRLLPKPGGTMATDAGFRFDDFDEDGKPLPDSDCEDDDSEWSRKRVKWGVKVARYNGLMDQKGPGMDLRGRRSHAETVGAMLIVSYIEEKRTVPYEAVVLEISAGERRRLQQEIGTDFMWVRFSNGDRLPITDEDDWDWQPRRAED